MFTNHKHKAKPAQMDMLHGPLLGRILVFALPFALSSVLQQLFVTIDIAIIGHYASSNALAAVGSNGPVINTLINLFVGVSIGANVIISNHIGRGDKQAIRDAVDTVTVLAPLSGIILLVLGVALTRPILVAMGTPPQVLTLAVKFLRIYFLGMPFIMVYNFGASVLRAMGDTKRPLYILLVAGIVNTGLNIAFVVGMNMSVVGAALATVISNGVSATLIVWLLLRESEPFNLHIKGAKMIKPEFVHILQIGIPAGLQGMVFSVSNIFVQAAVNSYGPAVIAGNAAALNFEMYCYFLIAAFNGAAVTFIGQNYGAGNFDRCRRVFWICMALAVSSCGIANVLFAWQAPHVLRIFSNEQDVINAGIVRMHTVLILQFMAASYEISASAMRGMGHSLQPALLTIFGTCVLRLAWIFVVCPHYPGLRVLFLAYPVSWGLTGVLVLVAYFRLTRKLWRAAPAQ